VEEKLRIKNLTGGYVVVGKDGSVKFDLYPEEKQKKGGKIEKK